VTDVTDRRDASPICKREKEYRQEENPAPSDCFFVRDGITAEGEVNQEQMVISDVDLGLLEEQRVNGTVLPLNDMIRDAYDRVIHYAAPRSKTLRPDAVAKSAEASIVIPKA